MKRVHNSKTDVSWFTCIIRPAKKAVSLCKEAWIKIKYRLSRLCHMTSWPETNGSKINYVQQVVSIECGNQKLDAMSVFSVIEVTRPSCDSEKNQPRNVVNIKWAKVSTTSSENEKTSQPDAEVLEHFQKSFQDENEVNPKQILNDFSSVISSEDKKIAKYEAWDTAYVDSKEEEKLENLEKLIEDSVKSDGKKKTPPSEVGNSENVESQQYEIIEIPNKGPAGSAISSQNKTSARSDADGSDKVKSQQAENVENLNQPHYENSSTFSNFKECLRSGSDRPEEVQLSEETYKDVIKLLEGVGLPESKQYLLSILEYETDLETLKKKTVDLESLRIGSDSPEELPLFEKANKGGIKLLEEEDLTGSKPYLLSHQEDVTAFETLKKEINKSIDLKKKALTDKRNCKEMLLLDDTYNDKKLRTKSIYNLYHGRIGICMSSNLGNGNCNTPEKRGIKLIGQSKAKLYLNKDTKDSPFLSNKTVGDSSLILLEIDVDNLKTLSQKYSLYELAPSFSNDQTISLDDGLLEPLQLRMSELLDQNSDNNHQLGLLLLYDVRRGRKTVLHCRFWMVTREMFSDAIRQTASVGDLYYTVIYPTDSRMNIYIPTFNSSYIHEKDELDDRLPGIVRMSLLGTYSNTDNGATLSGYMDPRIILYCDEITTGVNSQ